LLLGRASSLPLQRDQGDPVLRNSVVVALASWLALASCAVDGTASLDADQASIVATAETYFSVRADVRRCAAPACGGYFVSRLNRSTTRCSDGRNRAECYVASLDTAALGLTESDTTTLRDLLWTQGQVVLGGAITSGVRGFGVLAVTEAWIAGTTTGVARGEAVAVEQGGIRCITTPCPDKVETVLNVGTTSTIANLDFRPSRAADHEIAHAQDSLTEDSGGLLVFGSAYTYRENGQRARGRRVNQFYTRFVASPVVLTPAECEAAGGLVRTDIGDGSTRCEADEEQIGRVAIGREGGVCCI
jgi:hypothetical protein